ncbi:MAG: RtcB family protein [Pseudomonadota bacterium]
MQLKQINKYEWQLEQTGQMQVPGIIYASEKMMQVIRADESLKQVANVAHLPGIVKASMAMPDIHWGYGFPIGGVAAIDGEAGVVSPGGVGFDISCGIRLLRTNLDWEDIKGKERELVNNLFKEIPTGVGAHHLDFKLSSADLKEVLREGARWPVKKGYGTKDDLNYIEDNGTYPNSDPEAISARAMERGRPQLGTLGSGNHFVEVGRIEEVYIPEAADVLGLFPNQVTIMIHTGSRGFGHQVCDDYIGVMLKAAQKYGIDLPDKQLCCAPINSPEGKKYLGAMGAAVNFAYANRQMICHYVREVFEKVFGQNYESLGLRPVYDVSHNIAKFEEHLVNGQSKRLLVHRKGATRAFPPGHPAIPQAYKKIGQPVLIPGDMGRYSFVLVGTKLAMEKSFGSTCHGAGRLMSRHQAKRQAKGRNIEKELLDQGILVRGASFGTIVEEMSDAYKDVADVVDVVDKVGISRKVAKIKPLAVIKG